LIAQGEAIRLAWSTDGPDDLAAPTDELPDCRAPMVQYVGEYPEWWTTMSSMC
jgi:hypothetical protein